jgi:UDP-hydrolysing UDP-N-acetyl-D-glucosamine 2-epimerase
MRTIGVVTTSRADYGIYRPVLHAIQEDPGLRLRLLVSGTHLSPQFGFTVKEIEADGYEIAERIEILIASDTPEAVAKSMGLALMGFAQVFNRWQPDILLVSGDRFEMLSAALAAVPFNFPIAHMGGGDVTIGAIDDGLRHSLTKISHLHFPETDEARTTIVQMGEEPWRVTVSGAPSLENLLNAQLLTSGQLERQFPFRVSRPFLLVTYHPVTRQYREAGYQISQLLAALQEANLPVLFTMPNADTANDPIRKQILEFVAARESAWCVENLGSIAYFSVMALAEAMVGNSSSGIAEAASFHLPVVNVGIRQEGRMRARNVIDVGNASGEILAGIHRALDPEFRDSLHGLVNPFASECPSAVIVEKLKSVPIDANLMLKRFHRVANVF